MSELDPIIHQPTRLRLLMALSGVEQADFVFLQSSLGLTQGNLSTHMTKVEEAGYVEVTKTFEGKLPKTRFHLTALGRERLGEYWEALDQIRALAGRAGPAGKRRPRGEMSSARELPLRREPPPS
jgi:DNA-binding transcriptional ArsR family regulator